MKQYLFSVLLFLTILFSHTAHSGTLYMPEGYISDGTEEFLAILNAGSVDAQGTITFYYEDGVTVEAPVFFPANQRSSLDIKQFGVEFDRPFSTVIDTDEHITATLIHYDNGMALGANFTNTTSQKWTIAEGFASDDTRDYLSIFNPNDEKVKVEVTLMRYAMQSEKYAISIGGKRRFSFDLFNYINRLGWYTKEYGILIDSDKPIVASLSHYDDNLGDGALVMGHPHHGETSGYIAEGWISDNGLEFVNVLNPHEFAIMLKLEIQYNDGITEYLPDLYIGEYQRLGVKLNDYAKLEQGYMIKYSSVAADNWQWEENGYPEPGTPINSVANFVHFDHSGLNGVRFLKQPHTRWEFGEGFHSAEGESHVQEFMLVFNPSEQDANVTVTLIYDDGQAPTTIPLTVEAGKKSGLALHNEPTVREGYIWYGSVVESDVPVIPYFTHYDLGFGGSFALEGTPVPVVFE
jgi:hypothetical protein